MWELSGYFGLFLAAFGAATLLPMQSEAVLVGLLLTDRYAVWALLAVATTGNVLGSVLNWLLGRSIERYRHKRWFPVSEGKLERLSRLITASVAGHCCSVGCRSLVIHSQSSRVSCENPSGAFC